MQDKIDDIREYIINEFLPGESPDELTESTPLIKGGIIDSIGALKLLYYLEERFGIEFQAHEINYDNLNSISAIAGFINSKIK